MSLRTLVVDDHEAARLGLKELLRSTAISVAAAASSGPDALQILSDDPTLEAVLIDVQMKKMDGISLLSSIRQAHPELPVVVISAFDYIVYMARAVANGAQDYLLKSDAVETIETTVLHARDHFSSIPGGRLHRIRSKMTARTRPGELPKEFPLTSREAQVMRHIAFGLSNREISMSLDISVETVKEHVQNILRKTGAADRTDVAVRAVRAGLLD